MNLVILHYHLNRGGVTRVIQSHLEALECRLSGQPEAGAASASNDLEAENASACKKAKGVGGLLSKQAESEPPSANKDLQGPPQMGWQKQAEQKERAVSAPSGPMGQGPTEKILVLLLYGGRREAWPEDWTGKFSRLRVVLEPTPLLDYDQVHGRTGPGAEQALYQQIVQVLRRHGCRPDQTLLHVHNHSLGKNVALPAVLVRLAEDGYRMLLQIHDFAEDFRPANYRALLDWQRGRASRGRTGLGWLYPQAEHLHYAVLNSRDRQVLLRAGVPADRLHLLPNPVVAAGPLPPATEAKARLENQFGIPMGDRYLLYPVRAIRRKNLGEAVLCSLLAEASVWIGVTLAPLNPAEKGQYERWKQWTAQHHVRCVWETGEAGGLSLAQNLAAADALLTTSITEGFGMVFLESWLVGRPLVGRNLPEITEDFERLGLRLPGMWGRLAVPLDWLGEQELRQRLLERYQQVLADYQCPIPPNWADALEEKLADRAVDFGDLDETFQQKVLEKLLFPNPTLPTPRDRLLEKNPSLEWVVLARQEEQEELLQQNARVVKEHFSLHRRGQQLWALYQQVLQARQTSSVDELAHPERISESFLDLRRFRLLHA